MKDTKPTLQEIFDKFSRYLHKLDDKQRRIAPSTYRFHTLVLLTLPWWERRVTSRLICCRNEYGEGLD